jgi:translation initiation factor 2B subunit (eIF-2B alpha/beta/delta family)
LFSEKTRQIKYDRESGASQLVLNALNLLRSFSEKIKHETRQRFVEDFSEFGYKIFEIRPNIAPIQNLVAQIVYEVNILKDDNIDSVKRYIVTRIEEISRMSQMAINKSAQFASTLIHNSDLVATCSLSSTICETLKSAVQQGKSFKVLIAESKSSDGKFSYGKIMASFLKSLKLQVEVFLDDMIYQNIPKTNCVLVGADSVFWDGSIINGSPTYGVAVEAEEYNIPFYSVCETTKVNTLHFLGKNVGIREGFDLIPANLITKLVTEQGFLSKQRLLEIIKEKTKFYQIFKLE